MIEKKASLVTYAKEQNSIIRDGVKAINEVMNGTNTRAKRSILLCLDKYLDPYYGYNLPDYDDIIIILQKQLFLNNDKEVKKDILDLLYACSNGSLDYLADKLELLIEEPQLMKVALYALSNTCNDKYIPIFCKYKNHHNEIISYTANDILLEIEDEKSTNNK